MEPFLNRHKEQKRILANTTGEKSAFLILYGRRRIGKSALLRHLAGENDIYYLADQNEKHLQIAELAKLIGRIVQGFEQANYPTWDALFSALENSLPTRITLYLDEFPYLVGSGPELPSIIQKIIDLKRHTKFHLVVCGSSQQMMKELFEGSSAPLYGRADDIINLRSMEIEWLQKYLGTTPLQTIEEYATWGGVPRYWELRKKHSSYKDAVFGLILNRDSILYEEPMRLFLDDMRSAIQAYSIITLVGQGSQRLSEISAKLEKTATNLSRPLALLVNLGYLRREIPFGENEKNPKRTLYKIADPFLNFYFTFVVPNRSAIEQGITERVEKALEIRLPYYFSEAWEHLVRQSVPKTNYFGIEWNKAYRYWGKPDKRTEMELDLVAESADGTELLVGEVKWSENVDVQAIKEKLEKNIQLTPWPKIYKKIHLGIWMKNQIDNPIEGIRIFDANNIVRKIE
ncbi:MAG: ATP-binding protein [Cytophagales bacterium]|nr:ATP-binding protein [Cytophagales bacterium]